ncbi:hypothetical protein K440DRAFT_679526 [Wilcoxina mikolae CBS 423.85]|nr:hypothetical protein K440DRAFT_679526 [Wilcoxina mikolae CBS 423.85]
MGWRMVQDSPYPCSRDTDLSADLIFVQHTLVQDSGEKIQPEFLYPGMASTAEPYTPPLTPPSSSFREANFTEPHLVSQYSESVYAPNVYRNDHHPVAHTSTDLGVPIHSNLPVSSRVHHGGSPMLLSYDTASSRWVRHTTLEYTESNSRMPALAEYDGTDDYSTPHTASRPFVGARSHTSPRRGTSNDHAAASNGMSGNSLVSSGTNHNNHTVGPERGHRCRICGTLFKALGRHMQDVHRDTLDSPPAFLDCDECDRKGTKGFKRKDNLTQHLRNVHGQNIPKRNQR